MGRKVAGGRHTERDIDGTDAVRAATGAQAGRPDAAGDLDLQFVIDSIPAMAWSARADGTGNFFNRRYLDYVGLSLVDMQDWRWTSVVHPDDVGLVMKSWDNFSAARSGGEVEARLRRHDGVYRWFSLRSNPQCDARGDVVQWYGVNVDIEDQKHATLMLAGERQLLESIASARPLIAILATVCGVVEEALPNCHAEIRTIDVSGAFYEQAIAPSLPLSFVTNVVGMPLEGDPSPVGISAAENAELIVEDVETDPRCSRTFVRMLYKAHGLESVWCTPITSTAGTILGVLSVYRRAPALRTPDHHDVVGRAVHIASIAIERLRSDDELRRRAFLLATAERISKTGSFSWDLTTNKLLWSSQMYQIYELAEDLEPVYPNLLVTVHPDDVDHVDWKIARLFRGESTPEDDERLVMPDGRIKWISTASSLFHHNDGRRECIGVAQDITQRRAAEDALDQLRSELAHITRVSSLGELAASITHEVNQPLSGIITNASACLRMLAMVPPDVDGAIKTAQRSIRDGNRASEVIRRLRGLYRKQEFTPESLHLNDAAQEVIAICTHDLQRRRIRLTVNFDEMLPMVSGDRIQLQQVILNFMLNAADAIDSSDHELRMIVVETRQPAPGAAQLSVRDTGVGLPADDLGRIFDPFYTTKANGMGIGLSVSRSILERHAGKLWAAQNEGPGATFAFSLPCIERIE